MIKVAKTRSFRGKNWKLVVKKLPKLHDYIIPGTPFRHGRNWRIMENGENGENGDGPCGVLRTI
jgi:hypothetical protein